MNILKHIYIKSLRRNFKEAPCVIFKTPVRAKVIIWYHNLKRSNWRAYIEIKEKISTKNFEMFNASLWDASILTKKEFISIIHNRRLFILDDDMKLSILDKMRIMRAK